MTRAAYLCVKYREKLFQKTKTAPLYEAMILTLGCSVAKEHAVFKTNIMKTTQPRQMNSEITEDSRCLHTPQDFNPKSNRCFANI